MLRLYSAICLTIVLTEQFPIANPQSPIPNPQSPIPNPHEMAN